MISEIGAPDAVANDDDGEAAVWRPRPGLVISRVNGRMTQHHADAIIKIGDEAVRADPGNVVALHDWSRVESYEVAVHARMSAWTLRIIGSMRRVVIAVESPLVALAVRTVNLATGNRIEFASTSEEIERFVRAELG